MVLMGEEPSVWVGVMRRRLLFIWQALGRTQHIKRMNKIWMVSKGLLGGKGEESSRVNLYTLTFYVPKLFGKGNSRQLYRIMPPKTEKYKKVSKWCTLSKN